MKKLLISALTFSLLSCTSQHMSVDVASTPEDVVVDTSSIENSMRAVDAVSSGRRIFRHDTFGDESFWGGTLRLHEAIATVSPKTALAVGLKVDSDALPRSLIEKIKKGQVDLDDPATTVALLKLNAVVGVKGHVDDNNRLVNIGIQCALCHSTVDNSVTEGIGRRRDGWPNRDLNVGAIVSLAPNLSPFTDLLGVDDATVRAVLQSWGPGRYDAALMFDGKPFRPDGKTAATLIPPAFGMGGVNLATFTGWGSVSHWNALVAVLEMHGQGNFSDARLNSERFPLARKAGFAHVRSENDLVTPKLADLQAYQLSLEAPRPSQGSYDANVAAVGKTLFEGKARCAECHVPPLFTEPGWNLHTPEEIGIDGFQAERSPEGRYRTTPLRGLFTRAKGGYYHDGRFAQLSDVVTHYDRHFNLGLSSSESASLVEYLKSI